MIEVTIRTSTPEAEVVAYAERIDYGLGFGGLQNSPWVKVEGLKLTGKGDQLYLTASHLANASLTMICDDGLAFIECTAVDFSSPSAPTKFLVTDVLDKDGKSIYQK